MQAYFGYTSEENSFIFMAVGGEALLVYAVILNCSRRVEPIHRTSTTSFTKTFSIDISNQRLEPRNGCRILSERGVIAFSCCALTVALTGFLIIGAHLEPGLKIKSNRNINYLIDFIYFLIQEELTCWLHFWSCVE